jgi:outer membrane protein assembly factor BamB
VSTFPEAPGQRLASQSDMSTKPRLTLAAALAAACLASALPAAAPDAGRDPIEGRWLGDAGFPEDRIVLGLEFKRSEKGELKAYLYEPVLNFYGLELPGVVERNGLTYTHKEYAISLTLKGDTLEGTYFPLSAPASLRRTASLPSEVPVPEIPRGPQPKWQTKLGGAVYAPAAVRDGVAYVGTTGGILNAVRTSDGAFVWMFAAGRPIHGEALATEEHLFFVCDNGFLFKLDRNTGKEIWRYDLGDARVARILPHQVLDDLGIGEFDFDCASPKPLLADGVLYVGAGDGSFHALQATDGTRLWRFANSGAKEEDLSVPWNKRGTRKNRTDAVLDGSRVIFGSFDHHIYALDRQTGKEVWKKDTRAEITSAPALVAGKLIVGNRGGLLAALDPASGERLWRTTLWGSAVDSSAAAGSGTLFYLGSSDLRRISLMDSKDGRVLWRTDVFGWAWPRPAVTDKLVYASAVGGNPYQMRHLGSLSALDRETGRMVWRWPMPEWPGAWLNGFAAAPVVAGKTLVVGGLDGSLYGFEVE